MKILIPVDGSDYSLQAVKWAAQRAAETGGSITLLHVFSVTGEEVMGLANQSSEEIQHIREMEAAPSFDKAREAIGGIAPIADTITALGNPGEEIIGIAKAQGFEHIVMGSRGLSPIREWLLGSVSERVVRHSPCAVTIIR